MGIIHLNHFSGLTISIQELSSQTIEGMAMAKGDLTITDNRSGKSYELELELGALRAADLRQIKTSKDQLGLLSYDPSFANTAAAKSTITMVDGEAGQLCHRGYSIEALAESSSYPEVAYLLLFGELPSQAEFDGWKSEIARCASLPKEIESMMRAFPADSHPMGVFISMVAALGTFFPEARDVDDPEVRSQQVCHLIATLPTIAAFAYRNTQQLPFVYPDSDLSYTANLLRMLLKEPEREYEVKPAFAKALDVLFILHADHGQNCSTNVMRGIASSKSDPFGALAGAAAALFGPLHGGANEAVVRMLEEIKDVGNVSSYVDRVKAGEFRLMGFGHRVYKNYDPRARIIKQFADEVFKATDPSPLLEVALELERIALDDDFFVSRRLYPNVDFYSGIIYQAIGLPVEMYTLLFGIARSAGWLAQWQELITDPEQRIARPRQIYTGPKPRDYIPFEKR
jgi:citrate synthase